MKGRKASILLVEDEEPHAELVALAFEPHSARFSLVVADSLKKAREYLQQTHPDLVIADLLLPDGRGIELLTVRGTGSGFPLVIMTGQGTEEAAVEAIRAGALDYVVKSGLTLGDMPHIAERALREWDLLMERKYAQEELRESEDRYRTILETIEEGYYEIDLAGNFTFFNDSLCRILGYPAEELLGRNYRENTDKEAADKLHTIYNQVYDTEIPSKACGYEIVRKDGTRRHIELSASLIQDVRGKRTGFRGIIRDVTERKAAEEEKRRLERQLFKAQKMESLELMAGGVAHDLNNILSGIVSYPDLLLMDLPQDSPFRKPIETIKESGLRAADVVSDLLTMARGVVSDRKVINLNTMVEEYLGSMEQKDLEMRCPHITFKLGLDSDLLNVRCSPGHIRKSLMNLVINAVEAIESSGTVTIFTMNRYLDMALKGYEDVRQGEYVVLGVMDDGTGISPEDLERIFEPFYTKKMMGSSGTGLGLTVVWNTVLDHDGYINVKTGGEGTVFELYFPVYRDEVTAEEAAVGLEDYLGNGEKVLVIDDEKRQREIACGLLNKLGYSVDAVASGEGACEYLREHPVDLIVLDMIMPKGMNGRQTYEEIIRIRPGQRAVIASGFAQTEEVKIAQRLGAGRYIKKPYTLENIGIAVKEELEK
jgi:two-component system cell cycle sensor histidine kinase/response regulator CckA